MSTEQDKLPQVTQGDLGRSVQDKVRVLFVDDEQQILDGLRRQYRSMRGQWDMRFAISGDEALRHLRESPSDVVVSDMRMPGMSGTELLIQVQKSWPETTRIVLSGQTDKQDLEKGLGAIHQFFSKPCDPEEIRRAIRLVGDSSAMLRTGRLRRVVAGINSLPITALAYSQLRDALNSETATAEDIASVVQRDVGMSTKILQLVNSAFFGSPRRVDSVRDAVVMLGAKTIKAVAFAAGAFEAISKGDRCEAAISTLWSASGDVGLHASNIAKVKQFSAHAQESALLAGMLSMIGRAAFVRYLPGEFRLAVERAQSTGVPLEAAEQIECGAPQQCVGGYCLRLWGFASEIVEAVVYQANPAAGQPVDAQHPLSTLHEARSTIHAPPLVPQLVADQEFLRTVGADSGTQNKAIAA